MVLPNAASPFVPHSKLTALDGMEPDPGLYCVSRPNKALRTQEFLRFLYALPPIPVLRVVAVDNVSLHRNDLVKAALPDLWTAGIHLYYLPRYSAEPNDIEPVFLDAKHHELPELRHLSIPDLESAVDPALTNIHNRIVTRCQHQTRLAD